MKSDFCSELFMKSGKWEEIERRVVNPGESGNPEPQRVAAKCANYFFIWKCNNLQYTGFVLFCLDLLHVVTKNLNLLG